jgi:nicotinamide-nucleotide amidase
MLGLVQNTHFAYLARKLADLGLEVSRQTTVSDNPAELRAALQEAIARADLLIVTGGLGPTSDDVTRDIAAEILGRKLLVDENVLRAIHARFRLSRRPMPQQVEVQARVPEGAIVLPNANGTAPGLALHSPRSALHASRSSLLVLLLPGPPRELKPMFEEQAVPIIRDFVGEKNPLVVRILKVAVLGESVVAERVGPLVADLPGVELGYCARPGEVDVRVTVRPSGQSQSKELVALGEEAVARIHRALDSAVFGFGEDRMEEIVVRLLVDRRQTVAVAESCTGGFIANRITNVSGSSAVFINGVVTYSNESKTRLLGVSAATLEQFGAVSEPTAREMAEAVRTQSKTDFGIAVTGIAGPTGGTAEKPVGTVFIALSAKDETKVEHRVFRFDRETFKFVVSQYALDALRRRILNLPDHASLYRH